MPPPGLNLPPPPGLRAAAPPQPVIPNAARRSVRRDERDGSRRHGAARSGDRHRQRRQARRERRRAVAAARCSRRSGSRPRSVSMIGIIVGKVGSSASEYNKGLKGAKAILGDKSTPSTVAELKKTLSDIDTFLDDAKTKKNFRPDARDRQAAPGDGQQARRQERARLPREGERARRRDVGPDPLLLLGRHAS